MWLEDDGTKNFGVGRAEQVAVRVNATRARIISVRRRFGVGSNGQLFICLRSGFALAFVMSDSYRSSIPSSSLS